MQVIFWGAAQTVTGSMHLVESNGSRLLLDCGLYQGPRKQAFRRNRELPFDASNIDAAILSHAHIDHSGNLPCLYRNGFRGKIYTTAATRNLCTHMLLDSAEIQVSDVKYVNRKRRANNQTLFEPLYTPPDAMKTLKRFHAVDFLQEFEPVPGVQARLHVAGHMLGAAHVELNLPHPNHPPSRLVFSGDIGRPGMPILQNPSSIENVDYLIMEATYGDREHDASAGAEPILLDLVQKTWETGGKLLIPAFSVGRTQEITYYLNNLYEKGKLPPIKAFIDSPLAIDAHTVYQQHFDDFDERFAQQIIDEDDADPLAFPDLHLVRKARLSKELNRFKDPCIIIAASGMCEGGRILHHLRQHIGKPNTTILFAGYQAPHTLGRRILDGARQVNIFGDPFDVKADVVKLPSASGHADRSELLEWASNIADNGNLKKVALVHCDPEPAASFQTHLQQHDVGPVIIPARGETMTLAD